MIGHLCWAGFAAVAFGTGAMLDRDDAAGAQEAKNAVPKSGVGRGASGDRVGSCVAIQGLARHPVLIPGAGQGWASGRRY